jgi:hypothetical protein
MPHVRVPRYVARLVVDYFASRRLVDEYFAYAARPGASARRVARCRLPRPRRASGCLGTSRTRRRLLRLTRLVVDYFTYTTRSGASARHATRHRLLRLTWLVVITSPTPCVRVPRHVARLVTRLVVDYFASHGSSSTTSPTPRVLVTRLVIDYFAYATCLGASACRVARRRLFFLCRASGRAVSPLDFSSVGRTGSRRAPSHSIPRLDFAAT